MELLDLTLFNIFESETHFRLFFGASEYNQASSSGVQGVKVSKGLTQSSHF
jgi:hypothetical protein